MKKRVIRIIVAVLLAAALAQSAMAQDTIQYGNPRYMYYDIPPCCAYSGRQSIGVSNHAALGNIYTNMYTASSNKTDSVYGVAAPVYLPLTTTGDYMFYLFEKVNYNHVRLIDSAVYHIDSNQACDRYLSYFDTTGDTNLYSMIEVFFVEPHQIREQFLIGTNVSSVSVRFFMEFQCYYEYEDSVCEPMHHCSIPGCVVFIYGDSIMQIHAHETEHENLFQPSDTDSAYTYRTSPYFYPIMVPPDPGYHHYVDTLAACKPIVNFHLADVTEGTAIFYWYQGNGNGRYECSLGPADGQPEDNDAVEFHDGQNFLRYMDLPDGNYKAWARRVCYHNCRFHPDSTYYSDWSEPVEFTVGEPEPPAGIGDALLLPRLTLTPNPARGQVRVDCDEPMLRLTLHDLGGRTVLELSPMAASTVLDTGSLPAGAYLLTATTQRGTTTRKLSVER